MDITVSIFIISAHNLFSTFTNQLCKLQLYNGLEFQDYDICWMRQSQGKKTCSAVLKLA